MSAGLFSYSCALEGLHLVEAGAGTGKTFNIQNLLVRFVLAGVDIKEILIVTFTEAATGELRSRCFSILMHLRAYLLAKDDDSRRTAAGEKDFDRISRLVAQNSCCDSGEALRRVDAALRDFDRASISTIHGFCNSVLKENSFECGVRMNMDLTGDSKTLIDKIISDFMLLRLCGPDASQSEVTIWERAEVKKYLRAPVEAAVAGCGMFSIDWMGVPSSSVDIPDSIGNLTSGYKDAFRRKMVHEVFVFASNAVGQMRKRDNVFTYDDLLVGVRNALVVPSSAPLNEKKRAASLRALLRRKYRAAMIDEFQDTDSVQYDIFRSVFIDAPSEKASAPHSLFLIGDPKQAIYAFRGGDVDTYLRAAADCAVSGQKHTLSENHRSSAEFAAALNKIFLTGNPFGRTDIGMQKITVPEKSKKMYLRSPSVPALGGSLRFVVTDPASGNPNNGAAQEYAVAEVLRILSSGLVVNDGGGKGERPVSPGDIAVLTLSNSGVTAVSTALETAGVPVCGMIKDKSVFETDEFDLMKLFLEVANDPADTGKLSALLLSPYFRFDAGMLEDSIRTGAFEAVRSFFVSLAEEWDGNSFYRPFYTFMKYIPPGPSPSVYASLVRGAGGARALTDILHMAEILHEVSVRRGGMLPAGLLAYLERQENAEARDPDFAEKSRIRISTDDSAVKVMTVHKSKGLEFPIVVLPDLFSSDSNKQRSDDVNGGLYHSPDGTRFKDLLFDPARAAAIATERFEEKLRLAYVAFTRAQYQCVTIWGPTPERLCVFDYLLKREAMETPFVSAAEAVAIRKTVEMPELEDTLSVLKIPSLPVIDMRDALAKYTENPSVPDNNALNAPPLNVGIFVPENVEYLWSVHSFSSLMRDSMYADPLGGRDPGKDYDDEAPSAEPEAAEPSAVSGGVCDFPPGIATGTCWHRILELAAKKKFSTDGLDECVKTELEADFLLSRDPAEAAEQAASVADMMKKALTTPLPEAGFSFADVGQEAASGLIPEMDFHYALSHIRKGELAALLKQEYPDMQFENADMEGGFTGSLDLFFRHDGKYYITDWKSNMLGRDISCYSVENMKKAMLDHGYVLQEWIYVVAVLKYLRDRNIQIDSEDRYDSLFGGVFYCFLRGMGTPGRGVYYDRPPFALVRKIERLFGERPENAL